MFPVLKVIPLEGSDEGTYPINGSTEHRLFRVLVKRQHIIKSIDVTEEIDWFEGFLYADGSTLRLQESLMIPGDCILSHFLRKGEQC